MGGAWEVLLEEDGHAGGGRQTETRGATEGGAREETEGTRSTAGPGPQPWWWLTVEPTERGVMEEGWLLTPRGQPTVVEERRWRASEPGGCLGSGGPGWSRGLWRPKRRQTRGACTILMVGWGWAEELLDDSGGGGRSGWAFVSLRAFRDTLRIGSLQICLPINQIPWRSSSPSCIISSPSAAVQGAELHSRLTPSMACSLVVGTVAGSRTWSESNFRGSVARPSAGSQIWPESTPRRQQNPLEDHLRTRVLCIEWAERVVQVAGGVS